MIGCDCSVCVSIDPRNRRLRSSILVEEEDFRIVVDTTPDFRMQCLRAGLRKIDAIVYTHEHSDHILGLDDLRRFNWIQGRRIPAHGSAKVLEYLRRIFPYALEDSPSYKGLPQIDLKLIEETFDVGPFRLTPYELPHGATRTLGFLFERKANPSFAYLTDCKDVPPPVCSALRGIPLLILDGLRPTMHPTHLSIPESLEVAREIGAIKTLFTHIAHDVDHEATNRTFPSNVALAHDGLAVEL